MNIRPIVTRELRSYLTSPSIFVAVAAFLFLSGFLFYGTMSNYADLSANAEYRRQMGFEVLNYTKHVVGQVFFAINLLLVFIIPILTMRLIAEERKSGTFEVLRSLPFSDWDIVLAKFTACFLLTLILVALNSYQILVMLRFGSTEFLVILVATLGMILTAAAYVSIGLFASSLTESQITAAIIACVALLASRNSRTLRPMKSLPVAIFAISQFADCEFVQYAYVRDQSFSIDAADVRGAQFRHCGRAWMNTRKVAR